MTQPALASELGVTARTIGGIERGEHKGSAKIMAGVQRLLATYGGDDNVICGREEARLIRLYRGLSAEAQRAVITTAEALSAAGGTGQ
jgi:DNA-binding XRE family transcriptional regulator